MNEDKAAVKQLAELLAGVDRTFRDDFKRSNTVPRNLNLTLAQYQVITLVADKGQCSQKDIAAHLGVTGPTVVRIIDALENKGYVQRTRASKDRRIVLVSLTEKGQEAQQAAMSMHEQKLASILDRLPADMSKTLVGGLSALLSAATELA